MFGEFCPLQSMPDDSIFSGNAWFSFNQQISCRRIEVARALRSSSLALRGVIPTCFLDYVQSGEQHSARTNILKQPMLEAGRIRLPTSNKVVYLARALNFNHKACDLTVKVVPTQLLAYNLLCGHKCTLQLRNGAQTWLATTGQDHIGAHLLAICVECS
eukprot:2143593-Amphidinium_carterae.1